jgi:hypothetical protein
MRHLALSVLVLACLPGIGCDVGWLPGRPQVRGNGKIVEESRELPAFSAVEVGGALQATVSFGESPAFTLRGDENLLPFVQSEVRADRLVVSIRGPEGAGIAPTEPIKVIVTTPTIREVAAHGASTLRAASTPGAKFVAEAHGASSVEVQGLEVENLLVEAHGASTVKVAGRSGSFEAQASGASTVEAPDLAAETASVDVSGASSAEVRAAEGIRGEVSGASTLTVLGAPGERRVETSGASQVVYR